MTASEALTRKLAAAQRYSRFQGNTARSADPAGTPPTTHIHLAFPIYAPPVRLRERARGAPLLDNSSRYPQVDT
jgi:hypothetical protein